MIYFQLICWLLSTIKEGGIGTKPNYKFMVINSLLAIELKAIPIGNPTDNFYSKQKSSSLNVVQYDTISRSIIFYCQNLNNLTGKFKTNRLRILEYGQGVTLILLSTLTIF